MCDGFLFVRFFFSFTLLDLKSLQFICLLTFHLLIRMEFNGKRPQLSTHQNRIINNQLKTLTIIISHHTNKKKTIHVT